MDVGRVRDLYELWLIRQTRSGAVGGIPRMQGNPTSVFATAPPATRRRVHEPPGSQLRREWDSISGIPANGMEALRGAGDIPVPFRGVGAE